ncbi:MAG: hypothetical protein ACE15F_24895 [bacterium]
MSIFKNKKYAVLWTILRVWVGYQWLEAGWHKVMDPSHLWIGAKAGTAIQGFWLKADTELIVYGATEPDAKLTVQGQQITLRPDGSFTLRFYLPDGEQEYPIEATSADGTMKKKITFVVTRNSK